MLTGESSPVAKGTAAVAPAAPLADRIGMLHTGTVLTRGRARAVVVTTGARTALGAVSTELGTIGRVETPLQHRMERLANVVAGVVIVFGAVVLAVGLALGGDLQELFLTLITLAVSAIPEGLPITLTVALAVSVNRMARRRVIIRKLPAAETLGSCTVIGSDKTGTLTENRMTVRSIYAAGVEYAVEGSADGLAGELRRGGERVDPAAVEPLRAALEAAVLATEASLHVVDASEDGDDGDGGGNDDEAFEGLGDPLEIALLVAAARAGVRAEPLSHRYPRWGELPFDAERRYAATFCAHDGRDVVFVNGAPEVILERCTRAAGMAAFDGDALASEATRLAERGYRVIGVARRDLGPSGGRVEDHEALRELEFLALFGMLDPPREEAREALLACRSAGIRVVMITGDHATTATAIAHDLGIGGAHPVTLAGAQIEAMSDPALAAAVEGTDVYARVTPQHKLRIVRALQSHGEIVAVTGDGVNDAAALKAADVGVAMGRSGTDVAKEAAELIITDDNFASVYAAVEEGRFAFQNVRNATFFLISSGVAEVVAVVSSILFGFHPPFVPAQILWLNLVTDSAQGIGLAFEPGDPALLRMPPRPVREGLLSRLLTERLLIAGHLDGRRHAGALPLAARAHRRAARAGADRRADDDGAVPGPARVQRALGAQLAVRALTVQEPLPAGRVPRRARAARRGNLPAADAVRAPARAALRAAVAGDGRDVADDRGGRGTAQAIQAAATCAPEPRPRGGQAAGRSGGDALRHRGVCEREARAQTREGRFDRGVTRRNQLVRAGPVAEAGRAAQLGRDGEIRGAAVGSGEARLHEVERAHDRLDRRLAHAAPPAAVRPRRSRCRDESHANHDVRAGRAEHVRRHRVQHPAVDQSPSVQLDRTEDAGHRHAREHGVRERAPAHQHALAAIQVGGDQPERHVEVFERAAAGQRIKAGAERHVVGRRRPRQPRARELAEHRVEVRPELVRGHAQRRARRHGRADAGAGEEVDRHAGLRQRRHHAEVGVRAGRAGAEGEADGALEHVAGDPIDAAPGLEARAGVVADQRDGVARHDGQDVGAAGVHELLAITFAGTFRGRVRTVAQHDHVALAGQARAAEHAGLVIDADRDGGVGDLRERGTGRGARRAVHDHQGVAPQKFREQIDDRRGRRLGAGPRACDGDLRAEAAREGVVVREQAGLGDEIGKAGQLTRVARDADAVGEVEQERGAAEQPRRGERRVHEQHRRPLGAGQADRADQASASGVVTPAVLRCRQLRGSKLRATVASSSRSMRSGRSFGCSVASSFMQSACRSRRAANIGGRPYGIPRKPRRAPPRVEWRGPGRAERCRRMCSMDLELSGRAAIVTGGSRGIGRAVARELALEGADVAIVARGREALAATAEELARESGRRVVPIVADTGDDASVRAMVAQAAEALGRIDILVNCAAKAGGQGPVPRLAEITDAAFNDDMNVKVMGYLRCAREVAPHMQRQGWGRIINVSGLAARQAGSTIGSMRNVAVAAMTKNLADELGPHGINVTVVHPGTTRTEATPGVIAARAAAQGVAPEEVERRMADANAIRHLVDAREIAYVVAFLASPKSIAITGDAIAAGGGAPRAIHY